MARSSPHCIRISVILTYPESCVTVDASRCSYDRPPLGLCGLKEL